MSVEWQLVEDQLLAHSIVGIREVAHGHPSEVFSFFAYHAVYYEGFFQLCFDTLSNSLEVAQRTEHEAIERRAKILSTPEAWRGAGYFSNDPAVMEYAQETGDFNYCLPTGIQFNEVHDLFRASNKTCGREEA